MTPGRKPEKESQQIIGNETGVLDQQERQFIGGPIAGV